MTATALLPPLGDPDLLVNVDPATAQATVAAASASIRSYCRWHVGPSQTETITLDGSGTGVLPLPSLHVTDVATVTVAGVAESDFEWSEKGDLRRRCGLAWPLTYRSVVVTFTHGFDPLPDDLAWLTVAVARRALTNPEGHRSESIGSQYSATYGTSRDGTSPLGITFNEAEAGWLLGPYRIPLRP